MVRVPAMTQIFLKKNYHQLHYPTHRLENLQLPSEDTALNFQYWDVSSCNNLFHGQNWSFQQDSDPAHNPPVAGDKCSALHLHFRLAFCKSGPKPLGLHFVVQSSGDASKKRHPNTESLKRSLRKAAADFPVDVVHNLIYGWPQ